MTPQDRLIFALDVQGKKEAERYVRLLEGVVGCFKIGLELFISEGPDIVKMIREQSDANIFLDLKLHDIPATVKGALRSAEKLGVRYITIHSTEGEEMLTTAQEVKNSDNVIFSVINSLDMLYSIKGFYLSYRLGNHIRVYNIEFLALHKIHQ